MVLVKFRFLPLGVEATGCHGVQEKNPGFFQFISFVFILFLIDYFQEVFLLCEFVNAKLLCQWISGVLLVVSDLAFMPSHSLIYCILMYFLLQQLLQVKQYTQFWLWQLKFPLIFKVTLSGLVTEYKLSCHMSGTVCFWCLYMACIVAFCAFFWLTKPDMSKSLRFLDFPVNCLDLF